MRRAIGGGELLALLAGLYPTRQGAATPFAFWKMRALIEGGRGYYLPSSGSYYLIYHDHLICHFSPDGACHIPPGELNALGAISLPASAFDPIAGRLDGFEVHYGWNLRYDFGHRPAAVAGCSAVDFDFSSEGDYALAARIIAGDGGWMTAKRVARMAAFEAFDPALWFFVRDDATGRRVAVAISAYSPEVRETDLDWIFVLPEWQGRGVGRFPIGEVIGRCRERSDVVRVGGAVGFYRRCGFVNDALWVWAVKPGYEFHCPRIQP
ncbi:MAG: GNAT family N-acetyltransferase [Clostridiales bacterium]|nr:GNAT family N-acetyltransferase [Clostridiales bacterium]